MLFKFFLVFQLLACCAVVSSAATRDTSSEYFSPHDLCEHEIANVERKYGIPRKLFMAIGTIESGYALNSKQKRRPYPWAVCVAGESYFFPTSNAAIAAVKRFIAQGKRNIDVGCMQVNLLHHSRAFKTLEEAFNPRHNIDYAARFFVELKNTHKSWSLAVGYYHSRTKKFYEPYCVAVHNEWMRVRSQTANYNARLMQRMSSRLKSKMSFRSTFCALLDDNVSKKLHRLGLKTISKSVPKFFTDDSV